jgi:hemerythrin-like domain-containing protein
LFSQILHVNPGWPKKIKCVFILILNKNIFQYLDLFFCTFFLKNYFDMCHNAKQWASIYFTRLEDELLPPL